jgi:hypothetical protein
MNRMLHELEKATTDHWFATTDVDIEDLHCGDPINQPLCLIGRQLLAIATTRRRGVGAGEFAGVGQLPGETDRRGGTPLS